MPDPKPRRSIFDTLKKSADGRLGLTEAARLADKISVFPSVKAQRAEPTPDPTVDPTTDPTVAAQIRPLDQQSDHEMGHEPTTDPTPVGTPVGSVVPTGAPTHEPTIKHDPTNEPTYEPTHDPTFKNLVRGLTANKRRFLHYIIDHEPVGDDYIINRQTVANSLQFTQISIKRYFEEFAKLGFFRKETYRHGVCQGVRLFLVPSRCRQFKQVDPTYDPTPDPTKGNEPTIDPTRDPTPDPTSLSKIDRRENLSISQDRVNLTWPHLARFGFGSHQIEQITQALTELGKPTDKVVVSLDHAEWELENGKMVDKQGQPVTDPCSWVFRSLARTGYYRRPVGYVSSAEQAVRDAEAEARAVSQARQKAEQTRFEAWRDGLSPDALRNALQGHPGGNRDAWLKTVWKKQADAT